MTKIAKTIDDEILTDLLSGKLAPGQRLTLSKLKDRYRVGVTPLREALARLTATGLISAESNKGYRVELVNGRELSDLCNTLRLIETEALRLAMIHGDEAWETAVIGALYHLKKLQTLNDSVDPDELASRKKAFHDALVAGCQSTSILELRALLILRVERATRLAYALMNQSDSFNYAEHEALAEAALKRKTDEACRLLGEHIERHVGAAVDLLIGAEES